MLLRRGPHSGEPQPETKHGVRARWVQVCHVYRSGERYVTKGLGAVPDHTQCGSLKRDRLVSDAGGC